MKIKRFVAPDMRTAFAMVRQEHGPDAVILSNRVTEDGVEIVAASNYDEALVKHTLEAMRPANTTAPLHPLLDPAPHATAPTRAASTGAHNAAPTLSPAEAAANYFARRQATAAPATPAAPAPVRAEVPVAPPSAPVAIIAPVAAANEAPPRFTPSQDHATPPPTGGCRRANPVGVYGLWGKVRPKISPI